MWNKLLWMLLKWNTKNDQLVEVLIAILNTNVTFSPILSEPAIILRICFQPLCNLR